MKKQLKKKRVSVNKNILIVLGGIVCLEIVSFLLNGAAQYALFHFKNFPLGWLFNPWTRDMGFVGTPSLLAVFFSAILITYVSGKRGPFNAVIACTLDAVFWTVVNVFPYNPTFMTGEYIVAMLQIIPYYYFISLFGKLFIDKFAVTN